MIQFSSSGTSPFRTVAPPQGERELKHLLGQFRRKACCPPQGGRELKRRESVCGASRQPGKALIPAGLFLRLYPIASIIAPHLRRRRVRACVPVCGLRHQRQRTARQEPDAEQPVRRLHFRLGVQGDDQQRRGGCRGRSRARHGGFLYPRASTAGAALRTISSATASNVYTSVIQPPPV